MFETQECDQLSCEKSQTSFFLVPSPAFTPENPSKVEFLFAELGYNDELPLRVLVVSFP